MDLYQFNFQDNKGRIALIWEYGNFLEFREGGDNRIVLYDMGTFFAEIWFDAEMSNTRMVRGFRSIYCLEPYLEAIKINEIPT